MKDPKTSPIAVFAMEVAPRSQKTIYPQPFASRVSGREKRTLGDFFSLKNFGVNLTTLAPGAQSALLHRHSKQDEFIYILEGTPTLITESDEILLSAGMSAGFPAGGIAHHLVNKSSDKVVYLEVGDRSPDDITTYPQDDLIAKFQNEKWVFTNKKGETY